MPGWRGGEGERCSGSGAASGEKGRRPIHWERGGVGWAGMFGPSPGPRGPRLPQGARGEEAPAALGPKR